MLEIKVNEYVRTKTGIIGIVTDIQGDLIKYKNNNYDYIDYQSQLFEIVKHSNNILDLIEECDYVNGYPIFYNDDASEYQYFDYEAVEFKIIRNNKDIKTIETKEQFKQNCYEVEE